MLECHTWVVLAQSNLFLRLQCRLHHCPAVCWAWAIASNSYNILRMSLPWTRQHQQPVRLWNRVQSSCQNLASPLPESLNFSFSFLPLCPSYLAPSTLCFVFKPLMVCSTLCGSWHPAVSFLFSLSLRFLKICMAGRASSQWTLQSREHIVAYSSFTAGRTYAPIPQRLIRAGGCGSVWPVPSFRLREKRKWGHSTSASLHAHYQCPSRIKSRYALSGYRCWKFLPTLAPVI